MIHPPKKDINTNTNIQDWLEAALFGVSPLEYTSDDSLSAESTPESGDNPQPKSLPFTMLHLHPSSQVIRFNDERSVSIKVSALASLLDV